MGTGDFSLGSFLNSPDFASDPIEALKRKAATDPKIQKKLRLPRDVSHFLILHNDLPDEVAFKWLCKKITRSKESLNPIELTKLQNFCSELATRCSEQVGQNPLKRLQLWYRISTSNRAIKSLKESSLPEIYSKKEGLLTKIGQIIAHLMPAGKNRGEKKSEFLPDDHRVRFETALPEMLAMGVEKQARREETFNGLEGELSTIKSESPERFLKTLMNHPQVWLLLQEAGSALLDGIKTPRTSETMQKYLQSDPIKFKELLADALFDLSFVPDCFDIYYCDDLLGEIKALNLRPPPPHLFHLLDIIHTSMLTLLDTPYQSEPERLFRDSQHLLLQKYLSVAFPDLFYIGKVATVIGSVSVDKEYLDSASQKLYSKLEKRLVLLNEAVILNRLHGRKIPEHLVGELDKLLTALAPKTALKDDPVIQNYLTLLEASRSRPRR